jgi:thiol:disulfide interchange protein
VQGDLRQKHMALVVVAALAVFAVVSVVWAHAPDRGAGGVGWIWNDPLRAKTVAQAENKLILVDFWASWCVWCQKMDSETYPDPRVQKALAGYVKLKIDVDKMPAFKKLFGVNGLPTSVVVGPDGREIARREGYMPAAAFASFLEKPTAR